MNYFLLFFTIFSVALVLVHKQLIWFLRQNTSFSIGFKSNLTKRVVLISIGVFISIYYLLFKWRIGLEYLIKDDYLSSKWLSDSKLSLNQLELKPHRNQIISMVFLMDWCAALALVAPLLLVFDKNKKFWKPVGILSIFAATLTIADYCVKTKGSWSFSYFILGNQQIWGEDDPLFFMMHYWMLIIGIFFLMYTPKVTMKDGAILLGTSFVYIAYVLVMQKIFDCYSHTSGLGKGDYFDYYGFYLANNLNQSPAYHDVAAMINFDESIWWVCPIILYSLSAVFLVMIGLIKNYFDFLFDPEWNSNLINYKIEIENDELSFKKEINFFKSKK